MIAGEGHVVKELTFYLSLTHLLTHSPRLDCHHTTLCQDNRYIHTCMHTYTYMYMYMHSHRMGTRGMACKCSVVECSSDDLVDTLWVCQLLMLSV
jgi:hypothetical protein